jgi:hypothetical protein
MEAGVLGFSLYVKKRDMEVERMAARERGKRGKLGFPGEEFKGGEREQVGEEGPQRGG